MGPVAHSSALLFWTRCKLVLLTPLAFFENYSLDVVARCRWRVPGTCRRCAVLDDRHPRACTCRGWAVKASLPSFFSFLFFVMGSIIILQTLADNVQLRPSSWAQLLFSPDRRISITLAGNILTSILFRLRLCFDFVFNSSSIPALFLSRRCRCCNRFYGRAALTT